MMGVGVSVVLLVFVCTSWFWTFLQIGHPQLLFGWFVAADSEQQRTDARRDRPKELPPIDR
jgi:hypothetical protein